MHNCFHKLGHHRFRSHWTGLLALGLVFACAPLERASEDEGEAVPVLLASGSGVVGDQQLPYELWRAPRADGGFTFVQWVPAKTAGPRPVVVVTMPYDGVDWTGDALDEQFAARGAGFVADDACANDNDDRIPFFVSEPDEAVGNAFVYNFNDVGTLLVYGRFYACDGIDGDVLDMQAALSFLKTVADADTSRVATVGTSWGGFLALYGAARVPDGVCRPGCPPLEPLKTNTGSARSPLCS